MFQLKLKSYIVVQSLILSIVNFGQLIIGYVFGWSAPALLKLKDPNETPLPEVITDQQAAFIVSVYLIGLIIGPNTTSFLSNLAGRKASFVLGGVLFLVSFILIVMGNNLVMLYCGRFICGFAVSTVYVTHLVYIGEIASTSIRGIFLSTTAMFSNIGILISYSVGPYISYNAMGYLAITMTLVYMGGVLMIPESPLFFAIKEKEEKVKESLKTLRREDDFDSIISLKHDMETKGNHKWTDIITVKSNRRALFITLTLLGLQQISGNIIILSFVTMIFELAKSSISTYMSTILVGLAQIIAGCIGPLFVEKTGRKSLLVCSSAICFVSMGLLAAYFYLTEIKSPVTGSIDWLPVVSLVTFSMSYALGFGIVPSTFIGEMFTPNMRSAGASITITTSWIIGFAMTSAFGYLLQFGTHIAFWIFTAGCACACIFGLTCVPETKGKTLLEVQEMLSR